MMTQRIAEGTGCDLTRGLTAGRVGRECSHLAKDKVTLSQKTTGQMAQANNKMRTPARPQKNSSAPFLSPHHYPTV